MKKRCERCGKEFEATLPGHRLCPNCFSSWRKDPPSREPLSAQMLLTAYHDKEGNALKEVFVGVPEKLASIFDRDGLAIKQLRDFHRRIAKARNVSVLKGIGPARPLLYECLAHTEYQLKREKIPGTFAQFVRHHVALAEKDEKSIEGFFQHIDSVVCYFPKQR